MKNTFEKTLKMLLKIRCDILAQRESLFDRLEEEMRYENKRYADENPRIL